ncbi:MAG: DUF3467 domain-containing protein [Nitrospira sp.]|nr:DUF3467 domain-containing protein [Nitrospira sp.]
MKRKSSPAKTTNEPSEKKVQIQLVPSEGTPAYYCNYMDVTHSSYEFVLSFAKVPAKLRLDQLSAAENKGTLQIEPLVQVEVPPRLLPGIIKALTIQKEKFETQLGQIESEGPKNVRTQK